MIWPVTSLSLPVDPFQDFDRMHREMGRLFRDYSQRPAFPAINVWSNENEAVVSVNLPGVDSKDVSVSVDANVLAIEGERKAEQLGESDIQVRRERSSGRFTRSLRLPFEVETAKISARYENGILDVKLPRREATKPRKVEISVG